MLSAADTKAFEDRLADGGIVVFPADTVYGLACDPEATEAVERIARLKGRPPGQPSAVLFFDAELAHAVLPDLGGRTREALSRLLPGAVTLLVPNPGARFPLACGTDPSTLGVRVPDLSPATEALRTVRRAILQTSANLHGEPDPRTVDEIPSDLLGRAALVLDAGPLPGTPSTVVDLRRYELDHAFTVLRDGAVPAAEIAARLA